MQYRPFLLFTIVRDTKGDEGILVLIAVYLHG